LGFHYLLLLLLLLLLLMMMMMMMMMMLRVLLRVLLMLSDAGVLLHLMQHQVLFVPTFVHDMPKCRVAVGGR
jgi:hypothetical protein